MPIEAVVFDLDDTLVDESSAARAAVVPWAAEMRRDGAPDEVFAQWRALSREHYTRYQRREVSFEQQRRTRVRTFLAHLDLRDDAVADRAFAGYLRRYEQAWRCFDDAVPCLRRLRAAGVTVGVLTNGDGAHQRTKLDLVGLAGELDFVVTSSGLPALKPDRRAFLAACRAARRAPARCLMVGDDERVDVAGARAAGLHALLLARPPSEPPPAVPHVRGLDELGSASLAPLAAGRRGAPHP